MGENDSDESEISDNISNLEETEFDNGNESDNSSNGSK